MAPLIDSLDNPVGSKRDRLDLARARQGSENDFAAMCRFGGTFRPMRTSRQVCIRHIATNIVHRDRVAGLD